jgi:NADH-quinone oxidoreductase subunit H
MSTLLIIADVLAVFALVMANAVVVMYMERKVLAHLQSRLGPMRAGWHGLLQPIADALKLLAKEDVIPALGDRVLFALAPIMAFVPSLLVYASMPTFWGPTKAGLEVGVFYVFAVAALFPVGLLVAGWASHNKYSLLGGFRAAAQQVSYEVPLLLSVMGVVMLTDSLRLGDIVAGQSSVWYVWLQPLAFALYLIGVLAELNRVPFDMPEAESELVAGFNVEYSAMRFAVFFVAEYANLFTLSLLGAVLFLGGWAVPFAGPAAAGASIPLLGWALLLAKTYALVFAIIWARGTLPRLRVDQLMAFGWKLLLPLSIANVLLTAVGIIVGPWVLVLGGFAGVAVLGWVIARQGGWRYGAAPPTADMVGASEEARA